MGTGLTSTRGMGTRNDSMAITTKRRRKIQVNGRQFVWWVAPDDDSSDLLVHICSTDKRFLVHQALGQTGWRRFLVVIGSEFPPLQDAGGCWIRVRTPPWQDEIATPGLVREIIEWGLNPSKTVVRVNWLGAPVE